MLNVINNDGYLQITKVQNYDATGQPQLEVQLEAGFNLTDMFTRMADMEAKLMAMESDHIVEKALLEQHPGLKEIHDQYKMVLTLVKEGPKDVV